MAKKRAACSRREVKIYRKNKKTGKKTVIQTFMGRTGKGCAPRNIERGSEKAFQMTQHLEAAQTAMTKSSKACKGEKGKHFRACVSSEMARRG